MRANVHPILFNEAQNASRRRWCLLSSFIPVNVASGCAAQALQRFRTLAEEIPALRRTQFRVLKRNVLMHPLSRTMNCYGYGRSRTIPEWITAFLNGGLHRTTKKLRGDSTSRNVTFKVRY